MILFCGWSLVFGFDLEEELSSKFQKYFNWWLSDEYLQVPYSSVYPKDPFWDALKSAEDKTMQLKIAWVQNVEKELAAINCNLSRKKLWSLLYHYVPEFKKELERSLKMELWDYASNNFVFEKSKIDKYCKEFYVCEKSKSNENWEEGTEWNDAKWISASSAENPEVVCKEFFQRTYRAWHNSQQRIQSLQESQLGFDKYRNSTTDDSPYDIMIDLWTIARLLYEDSEAAITPVFYNLPVFSNSANILKNSRIADERVWNANPWNGWNWNGWNGGGGNRNDNWWENTPSDPVPLPLSDNPGSFDMEWWYWDLIEWLWASSSQGNSISNWDVCGGGGWGSEPEPESTNDNNTSDVESRELPEISEEEYEELVDYMLGAVDTYASLPEEKRNEMQRKAWDTNAYVSDTSSDELEQTAKKIKNCWESCEWLRIDQKASCMLMCACWEVKSPIFDPESTPGLWPIFMIRFCAVPGMNTNFSKWWKKIFSIEEWVREIFGAVDKLSREWRLWVWTQQYNFLDSSTKKMNIADTFAFTISIEFVDIGDKAPKHSEQYQRKQAKNENRSWQMLYYVANPLNTNLKNRYRVMQDPWQKKWDIMAAANPYASDKAKSDVNVEETPLVNPSSDSDADRYVGVAESLNRF